MFPIGVILLLCVVAHAIPQTSVLGARLLTGESKELIAGCVIVRAESLDDASRWATRYVDAVEADEVDLCELEA